MSDIILKFPELRGGVEHGINHADIVTFSKDPCYYVVRECAQNTNDAASGDGPPILKFNVSNIPISKLPCLLSIKTVLLSLNEYKTDDPKVNNYCQKSLSILSQRTLPVMIIEDFNTTGLTGGDSDTNEPWCGLVKSKGSSIKDSDSGGSYGIGKFAAMAASHLRTVYYSTKTIKGSAFQGVSVQPTHRDSKKYKTQGSGYIGYYDDAPKDENENYFPAVRNEDEIPEIFLRKEIGTSIFIPGYVGNDDWQDKTIKSLLNDFWLAILQEKISFEVGDIVINATNIVSFIEKLKDSEDFTAYRYYRAYSQGTHYKISLNLIDNFNLYLLEEDEYDDKQVAYMRRNLMLIYEETNFRFRKNFTGLFVCENLIGNKVLRAMEPPKHDGWLPNILKSSGSNVDGNVLLNNIRKQINEKLKELMPLTISPEFDLSEAAQYLPYTENPEDTDEVENQNGEEEQKEVFRKVASETGLIKIPVHTILDFAKDVDGEEDVDRERYVDGERYVDDERDERVSNPGPDEWGGTDNKVSANIPPIKSRVLTYNRKEDFYIVSLTALDSFTGSLSVSSIGDDGRNEQIKITSATSKGKSLLIRSNGSAEIKLDKGSPTRIKFQVENYEEISLELIYEK